MATPAGGTQETDGAEARLIPTTVRRVVLGVVGVMLAFSLYLFAVNGQALLYDLAHAAIAFCF